MRLLLALIIFPLSVFAHVDPELTGVWTMTNRQCGSGAPVFGGFNPRYDHVDLHFYADQSVYEDATLNGCHYELEGIYSIVGQILSMRPYFYRSTCGPVVTPAQINYSYKINADVMDLFIPMNGGHCPAHDVLQLTFKKIP